MADAARFDLAPPEPTEAQRALAREAARLALAHPHPDPGRYSGEVASIITGEDGLSSFINSDSFGINQMSESLLDLGTITIVALRLHLAGHHDAVQQMGNGLRLARDPERAAARAAIQILLGDRPQLPRGIFIENKTVAAMQLALAASAEQTLRTTDRTDIALATLAAKHPYAQAASEAVPLRPVDYGSDAEAWGAYLVAYWLSSTGRLAEAHRFVLDRRLVADCVMVTGVQRRTLIMDSFAIAGHWPQLMELVAASNRLCLEGFLNSRAAGLAMEAGQRDALRAALRTALARPMRPTLDEPVLVGDLAELGFLEEAEQEIAANQAAGNTVPAASFAAVAAAAAVAGDRPRLDQYWSMLDLAASGDTRRIAEYLTVAALRSGRVLEDWQVRARDWLGLEEQDLATAFAFQFDLLDPVIVRKNPALQTLVGRAAEVWSAPSHVSLLRPAAGIWQSESPLQPSPGYRSYDMRLAAWKRDRPISEMAWFISDPLAILSVAEAAAGWYDDPALLDELLTIAETAAQASSATLGDGNGAQPRASHFGPPQYCFVPLVALELSQTRTRAVDLLVRPGLFEAEQDYDMCLVRAARILALRGHPDDALRVAMATRNPAARSLALAESLTPPLPVELVAWRDRMHRRAAIPRWTL